MPETIFEHIKGEMINGASQKKHPFHFGTLGTVGVDCTVRLRTVVVRDVSDDLVITFYTDKRSKKITHIHENHKVSLLLFDQKNMMQLKIEGVAVIRKNNDTQEEIWNKMTAESQADYSTAQAPGSDLENPEELEYLQDENYFCIATNAGNLTGQCDCAA